MDYLDLKLQTYADSDYYPFHMPGHKRAVDALKNPYRIDITEIDGFDNLHAPSGILKEAGERASRLYGAKRSYFLVNGSTCGILAAVSASVKKNGALLMARNSHKSVYHAAYLRSLPVVYINPAKSNFGVSGAITPLEIKERLKANPQIGAVIITSPTYEGIVSDIASISEIVHEYEIPLIVDEAHGAHFGFHRAFPQTAVRLGADIVIQSMHKQLPSLTQTALLHLNSSYINPQTVQKYLEIYETSSPSYVLMAGMERCIRMLLEKRESLYEDYVSMLDDFYENTRNLSKLHVMRREDFSSDEIFDLDRSKLVISTKNAEISGKNLYDILRKDYHLQMEMCAGSYALGMTSIMDQREGFFRLAQALAEIDRDVSYVPGGDDFIGELTESFYEKKEKGLELYEAMELPAEKISFQKASGRMAASFVSLYPPGVPAIVPGEVIDETFLENIRKCRKLRLNLQGVADIINERIEVVNS